MATVNFPASDPGLLAWSLNFSTRITAAPIPLGLTAAQATAYSTLHTNFATALAACDPGERSKSLVAAKNSARLALKTSARLLASIIQGQASVSDAQKLELGLTVRAMPSPIPPPAFPPAVDILSVVGRTVKIRIHDSTDASRRGKPPGVKGAAVFSFVGDAAPDDPGAYRFEGNTTLTKFDIAFPVSVAPGTQVWITAMWFNERAQSGPGCDAVGTKIQFGMPMAA